MGLVKSCGSFKRLGYFEKPTDIPHGCAMVYIQKTGEAISVTNIAPLTRAELMSKSITYYYEIDLTHYRIEFSEEYEDVEQLDKFSVEVSYTLYVVDSKAFVEACINQAQPQDIDVQLRKSIETRLKKTARKYKVKDAKSRNTFVTTIENGKFFVDILEEMHDIGVEVKDLQVIAGKGKAEIEDQKRDRGVEKEEVKQKELYIEIQGIYNKYGREGLRRRFIGKPELYEKICILLEHEKQDYKDSKDMIVDIMRTAKDLGYEIEELTTIIKTLPTSGHTSEYKVIPKLIRASTDEEES